MHVRRIDYGDWALRVLTWDTLLPACVGLVPHGVELVFPHRRGPLEVVAVILPIVAFFLRIRAGRRQIASNHCSRGVRAVQFGVFLLGILPLVLIDSALILTHIMPPMAFERGDWLALAIVLAGYLVLMTVAMYPGSVEVEVVDPLGEESL
jgi:hypothetical protein